jgi:hypothetical protein
MFALKANGRCMHHPLAHGWCCSLLASTTGHNHWFYVLFLACACLLWRAEPPCGAAAGAAVCEVCGRPGRRRHPGALQVGAAACLFFDGCILSCSALLMLRCRSTLPSVNKHAVCASLHKSVCRTSVMLSLGYAGSSGCKPHHDHHSAAAIAAIAADAGVT